ncbi:MAG: histidine phosphatase family protein [Defluviimonas sp.]|uniref:histidine phosphatase family protein n=1 Tax=Albidovulum sp. TaxID=1872424 RepID=UPI001E03A116|nr:histidine phosphatase family protein [Paracoccaceae bacterium]MCC0064369.1 histidine phosphatase family protein [Defluviimonas sp.]
MAASWATDLILIRHAPALTEGRLCGRRDVAADCSDPAALAAVRAQVGTPPRLITSGALRARQTAEALWSGVPGIIEAAFLEQDFGEWEGQPADALPDLGALTPDALAQFRPPGGESFGDLCRRIVPALEALAGGETTVVVAHAGTVRAALARAIGSQAGALSFEVAPLSVTRLRITSAGWSVAGVNWTGP